MCKNLMLGLGGIVTLACLCVSAQTTPSTNPDATFHAAPQPLPVGAVTSDWPTLLGPMYNMHSPETHLLRDFPKKGPPLVWEVNKGDGYAAPAILGGRLVLFHRINDQAIVDCLNAQDGRRFWRFAYPTAYHDRYGFNHGPRCSPVIADDTVFTFGADGQLHALDLQTGQVRWQHDILSEFKLKPNFFGVGSTPLVESGNVIINIGADGGPCVAAFDAHTGKRVWGAGTEWGPSYATPVPALVNGRRRLFVFAGGESDPPTGGLLDIDPTTGQIENRFPWRGKRYESVNASAPVAIGSNQVFISECYGAGGALVAMDGTGGCHVVWTNSQFGTHFMTAVAKDGCLYGVDGHGPGDAFLVCADLKTGHELWRVKPTWTEAVETRQGRRKLTLGTVRCSLMLVDDRCLCLGEFGHLLWLDLQPQGYRELSRAQLFLAPNTWTPPVLSCGLLYVCQNSRDTVHGTPPRLLCYDLRADNH